MTRDDLKHHMPQVTTMPRATATAFMDALFALRNYKSFRKNHDGIFDKGVIQQMPDRS